MYDIHDEINIHRISSEKEVLEMADIMDISKWFLANNPSVANPSRAGNIKLQKLLYYSKAMHFAVYEEPLFTDPFEAWENGPVAKSAYIEYRHNGLPERFNKSDCPELEANIERVLKVVNHIYGSQTTGSLIDLTHQEKPWKDLESEVEQRNNPIIKDETIKDYYKTLKVLFDMTDEDEITNTIFTNINGNVFSFDKRYTALMAEDKDKLYAYGEIEKDNSYAVYKNESDDLVVY